MKFNQKIKEKLIKNKYIFKVTDNQIIYTNKFKILLWKEFNQGKDPKEIFKKYNLDLNIIGKDNPRRLISRIRKEVERKENKDKKDIEEIFKKEKKHKETRGRKKKILPKNWEKELENLSLEEQNKYLKHKIALMEKESVLFPYLREEIKLKKKIKNLKTKKFKIIESILKNNNDNNDNNNNNSNNKQDKYELNILLNLYGLSKSGYYKYLKNNSVRIEKDNNDFKEIKAIYDKEKGKYGYRQITIELDTKGFKWSKNKVQRLMQLNNLKAIIRKKKKTKPYQDMKEKTEEERNNIYPNHLNQNFNFVTPYRFFTTDITYFFYLDKSNKEIPIYLSVIKDLASKKVIAWNISENIYISLVLNMMNKFKEYFKRNNLDLNNVLIHSDQGVHYTSKIYSNLLKDLGIIQSMSRKGNSYDNAPIESFFGHMKDFVDERGLDKDTLVKEIINYLNKYNDKKQWNLSKLSPNEYEKVLLNNLNKV